MGWKTNNKIVIIKIRITKSHPGPQNESLLTWVHDFMLKWQWVEQITICVFYRFNGNMYNSSDCNIHSVL